MEGIGSEVSHKIRAAIKAKLVELGAYIDDELPDYIMVMVANKRSRHQMDEDLQLFLGSNTKTFTSWLHTVLQKLQEVTVANFDMKKEAQSTKRSKRKRSNSEEAVRKERKSSEERTKSNKKHGKKHKEGKKVKKSKHKNKDKEKSKSVEKRQTKTEFEKGDRRKKLSLNEDCSVSHRAVQGGAEDNTKVRDLEEYAMKVDNSYESAGLTGSENADRFKTFRRNRSSSVSSSASHFTDELPRAKIGNGSREGNAIEQNEFTFKTGLIENEFNIEPPQPNEIGDQIVSEKLDSKTKESRTESQTTSGASAGMTIKAPTRELLKEHDKILSEAEGNISKDRKKSDQESEESVSPEEMRKQLLLSRAKKTLEQCKIPGRMTSNSPEVEIIKSSIAGIQEDRYSNLQNRTVSVPSQQREREEDGRSGVNSSSRHTDGVGLNVIEGRRNSPRKFKCDSESSSQNEKTVKNEDKKNVISISKSLEMEKNLGVKSEEHKSARSKTSYSSKKKPVPSRIVTIPEPEAPEIPSIVKVKPREYIPKDKQANKVLILKAVADAEKSIATVHNRNDGDVEAKKSEALFTKNLRGKRYEKLAVTLSNVQGDVVDRDKTKRMVSVDSENANVLERKTESVKGSELSQGFRSIPELTLKNISNKSEDQFISSKTSAMEKNDKYIHCWLEGVEKAVKDDEIVNPNEMDDFLGHFSDEGKEEDDAFVEDDDDGRKKLKIDGEDSFAEEGQKTRKQTEKTSVSTKVNKDEGPQIVVTLDGLTSKAIKDIILRNRDTPNGPLLVNKKTVKNKDLDDDDEEEIGKFRYKDTDSSKNAGTSRHSDSEGLDKVGGFEKISERFGRINKTSELHEYKEKYYEFERERYEKKYLKYQGTDKEKHYEKLKDKYASAGESKNKKLIARLSEKFGKVDREFENKKRKYSDDDLRYTYSSRRLERPVERDGKSRKLDKKSLRSVNR